MTDLPILGAALRIERLDAYKDWILDQQRDLEIQDPTYDFPRGAWQEKADLWHSKLSDYKGRMGVHGPYDGIAIASRDPDVQGFAQAKLLDCLDFCEAIGASHCVIHSPFHFLGSSSACHTPSFGLDGLVTSARETLAPVLEKAESIGCLLVVENIFDRHTAPPELRPRPDFLQNGSGTEPRILHSGSGNGSRPYPPPGYQRRKRLPLDARPRRYQLDWRLCSHREDRRHASSHPRGQGYRGRLQLPHRVRTGPLTVGRGAGAVPHRFDP